MCRTDVEREAQIRQANRDGCGEGYPTVNNDRDIALLLRLLDEASAEVARAINTMRQQAEMIMAQQREIARLTAPPGANAMEIAEQVGEEMFGNINAAVSTGPIARAIGAAEARGLTAGIEAALEILHEEGWLGRSEQRIRALGTAPQESKTPPC